jgi:hypothetical protein
VLIGRAVAVVVLAVAVIVCAGCGTGDTGVLRSSADAEELTCRRTYALAAAGRGWDVVFVGGAVAVIV